MSHFIHYFVTLYSLFFTFYSLLCPILFTILSHFIHYFVPFYSLFCHILFTSLSHFIHYFVTCYSLFCHVLFIMLSYFVWYRRWYGPASEKGLRVCVNPVTAKPSSKQHGVSGGDQIEGPPWLWFWISEEWAREYIAFWLCFLLSIFYCQHVIQNYAFVTNQNIHCLTCQKFECPRYE